MAIFYGTTPVRALYYGNAAIGIFAGAVSLIGSAVSKLITTAFTATGLNLPSSPLIGTKIADSSVSMTSVPYTSSYTPIALPSSPLIGTRIATFREG